MTKLSRIALGIGMVMLATPALAAETYFVSGQGPVYIADPTQELLYNRTLADDPDLFQFHVSSTTPFSVAVLIPDEPDAAQQLALVMRGTRTPVDQALHLDARLPSALPSYTDPRTRKTYLVAAATSGELQPDDYEIQVSSPNNDATYALLFGKDLAVAPAGGAYPASTTEPASPASRRTAWIVIGLGLACAAAFALSRSRKAS